MLCELFLKDLARARAHLEGNRAQVALACLRAPGVHAAAAYRLGHWALGLPLAARILADPLYVLLNFFVQAVWGIEISRHAKIGPGLYVGHFGGITVSSRAVIGANFAISQCVTIGVAGDGEREGAPTIGDDVYIAPGARVFGAIRIGSNVKIGANAVVHKDIPDHAVVALDPGFKIISYKGNRRWLSSVS